MQTSRLPVSRTVRQVPAATAAPAGAVSRARAVAALAAAGVAWGTSVPLSKAAMSWLPPAWLVVGRFAVAAAVLLALVDRRAVRSALRWQILAWGGAGLGGSVLVQNMGLARTSVTHAALLIGTAPVLVAVIAAAWHRDVARPAAWAGSAVSVGGVAVVASGHGGGASGAGDALVLASVLIVAAMTVAQRRFLQGQDPAAVTAVQFLGAAIAALPVAICTAGAPPAPAAGAAGALAVLAAAGLASAGTLVPFTLFAYGQRAVPTEVAGAFLNLEPLVGSLTGVAAFGDPAGAPLFLGGAAILGGIAMSSLPALRGRPAPAAEGAVGRAASPGGASPAVLGRGRDATRAQERGERPVAGRAALAARSRAAVGSSPAAARADPRLQGNR
jgi:O-acetylserine/cysteine efflux transporter